MKMIDEDAINVYIDGSSFQKPRRGGMGLRIIIVDENGNEKFEDIPLTGYMGATNNQMELLACLNGIKEAKKSQYHKYKKIIIFTDSKYVENNYKKAIFQWGQNKWKNKYGRPILNAEIWKEIVKEIRTSTKRITIEWIKGHSKDKNNTAVDKIAKASAKGFLLPNRTVVKLRRKITANSIVIGSVALSGQRLTIRIINDQYLKIQKFYKYQYEVISKKSKYYGKADIAFSKILLNAGHKYYVKMSDDNMNPNILKIYKEIK